MCLLNLYEQTGAASMKKLLGVSLVRKLNDVSKLQTCQRKYDPALSSQY